MNGKESAQIARLDEKVKGLNNKIDDVHENIIEIKDDLKNIREASNLRTENCYARFRGIESKVYAASGGLALLSLIVALKALGIW